MWLDPSEPNEIVATDIGGPFPLTVNGNRYIIVEVCCFSKFLGIYALNIQEATQIANRLTYEWIGTFGVPKAFLSDRGQSYQSMLMELVYYLKGRRNSDVAKRRWGPKS